MTFGNFWGFAFFVPDDYWDFVVLQKFFLVFLLQRLINKRL